MAREVTPIQILSLFREFPDYGDFNPLAKETLYSITQLYQRYDWMSKYQRSKYNGKDCMITIACEKCGKPLAVKLPLRTYKGVLNINLVYRLKGVMVPREVMVDFLKNQKVSNYAIRILTEGRCYNCLENHVQSN